MLQSVQRTVSITNALDIYMSSSPADLPTSAPGQSEKEQQHAPAHPHPRRLHTQNSRSDLVPADFRYYHDASMMTDHRMRRMSYLAAPLRRR